MKKCKKIISIFALMIILISLLQNIVLGATPISSANLIKGDKIETNVKFDNGTESYEIEAHYIYYTDGENEHPAYCITHRS